MPLLFVVIYVFSGWDVSETFNVYDDSIISGSWSEKKNMELGTQEYKVLSTTLTKDTDGIVRFKYCNDKFITLHYRYKDDNDNYTQYISYSFNGTDWTTFKSSLSFYAGDIAYGNNTYVIIGKANTDKIAYSNDFIVWKETRGYGMAFSSKIIFGNGLFVAGGVNGFTTSYYEYIIYSSDGKSWKYTLLSSNDVNMYDCEHLCYGNGIFVYTNCYKGYYSSDGKSWNKITTRDMGYTNLLYANNLFMAYGTNSRNHIKISSNGKSWTNYNYIPPSGMEEFRVQTMCYGLGKFICTSHTATGYFYSNDGIAWEVLLSNPTYYTSSSILAYGNGLWIGIYCNTPNNKTFFYIFIAKLMVSSEFEVIN